MVDEPVAFQPIISEIPRDKISTIPPVNDFSIKLIDLGIFKSIRGVATNNKVCFYEVPKGKRFFVTASSLAWDYNTTTPGSADAAVYIDTQPILTLLAPGTAGAFDHISKSYSVPIPVNAGDCIEVESGQANLDVVAVITGFLVDDFVDFKAKD